jgi:hypothetical protein
MDKFARRAFILHVCPFGEADLFGKAVARAGIQIEAVEFFQVLDAFEAARAKGALAIESVEDDALEQIAKRHIVILAECFEHFQDSRFHANAGLHALDDELFVFRHDALSFPSYQCTKVPE